ncbi:DNA polymerase III, alpha subunit, Gram-positive type [Mycoplasma haemofelis str. Langford 1]|uniref:DNA polymerase III PolC-type n=1 Tax=Mycoplasma haemofelis (strain Langford 1) TaxID=941640 RepID=E8ZKH8_MYCHL|nr:PolC-type DNA polymerase III [Mycoplasma haemofelis]CBY92144.1 DNA polymerase III, alpha subunit, Gram-positive type [Mycoplasma haemofelis str. Langford 1]
MNLKYRHIFVEKFQVFNPEEWEKLLPNVEISFRKDDALTIVHFTFSFLSIPKDALFLERLFRFNSDDLEVKHEGAISLTLSQKNLVFESESLLPLINDYLKNFEASVAPEGINFAYPDIFLSEPLNVVAEAKLSSFLRFSIKKDINIALEAPPAPAPATKKNDTKTDILRLFHIEERVDLKGNKKYKLGLTNWEKFYWLSLKEEAYKDNREILNQLGMGKWYECSFSLYPAGSKYSVYVDGNITSISFVEDEFANLEKEEKSIVPLSIHTKFSAFDGLYVFKDFVSKAKALGHKALGVTDFTSVQSFAEIERVSRKEGIKPIYGAELEIVPDEYPFIINTDYQREDQYNVYCVFDIETTGLNPLFDEITEIAIYKYSNKRRIATYHSYFKISEPLKQHIKDLTHITDELLAEKGQDLEVVLKEVKDFTQGSVLVAHNGIEFDFPFLNAKYIKLGMEPLSNPLIDTLRLSQTIFSEEKYKSHSLGAICKRVGVEYDLEHAHSADFDVDVLWQVFMYSLEPKLKEWGVNLEDGLKEANDAVFNKGVFNYIHGHKALVYVKNQAGVKDLYEILSIAQTEQYLGKPQISRNSISSYRENLLIVSPPLNSEPIALLLRDDISTFLKASEFYDYLIIPPPSHFVHEVSRNNLDTEEVNALLAKLYELSKEHSIKLLFNYAARYIHPQEYQQYLTLIHTKGLSGKRHPLYKSGANNMDFPLFHYRTTSEFLEEYGFLGIPKEELLDIAFKSQQEFLDSVEGGIEVIKKKLHPPIIEGCSDNLENFCRGKLKELYGENTHEFLEKRFSFELSSIKNNNYSVIYWVSYLLVQESINNGYLVGSRGSVGSSLIAFLLNISEVNPLPPHYRCAKCSVFELHEEFTESGFDLPDKECPHCGAILGKDGHHIPFETFMGYGGSKVPDIDLNFSGEYQNRAHNFLRDLLGHDRVYRAGTISTMAEKTAFAIVKTYEEETQQELGLGKLNWIAKQIIDVKRTSGQHPGGILVIPNDKTIYDFSPINYPANDTSSDWLTTHLEFEDLHDALLKFDILGHDDPTTLALLKEITGQDPRNVPTDDREVLNLFKSRKGIGIEDSSDFVGEDETGAIGLPEFGTLLTRKIIRTCDPNSFADLIRISGFSHGTGVWKQNIDKLIKSKQYKLNQVITCRDDITLHLCSAGIQMEEAFAISESIRKGKGVSEAQLKLMQDNKVPQWYIDSAKKMTYIFPKAHATAYVLMSWKIAWYKRYHTLAFFAVFFTLRRDDFDYSLLVKNDIEAVKDKYHDIFKKMKSNNFEVKSTLKTKDKSAFYVYEAALEFLKCGFRFKNISINESDFSKFIPQGQELLIPFIVIDGLGAIKAKHLVEKRNEEGPFQSLNDFAKRTKLNRTVIQKLKESNVIPPEWAVI